MSPKPIPKVNLDRLTPTELETYLKNLHTEKALVLAQVREYDKTIQRVNVYIRDLKNPGSPRKLLHFVALGYVTNKELAQKLGINNLAVRRRTAALVKEGLLTTNWDNGHVVYELAKK